VSLAKRFALVVAAIAVVVPQAAVGATPVGHTEEGSYVAAGLFVSGHGNLVGHEAHIVVPEDSTPVVFRPRPGEHYLRLEVTDDLAPVPLVYVKQGSASGHHGLMVDTCEATVPIALVSNKPVEVWVLNGFCRNHNWGAATSGTIKAVFSAKA
jgi:hypothetical protein